LCFNGAANTMREYFSTAFELFGLACSVFNGRQQC
jgi:hypothetical protein